MKLGSDQLASYLQRQLSLVYIISGDEPLQVSECADLVRKKAKEQGYAERIVYHVDNIFDWRELLGAANSLSLFSYKRIFEVRMPNGKPGESGKKALMEYMKAPSTDNLLLLITGRIEGQAQKSKWFKTLDKNGVFIPVWPIESNKLPGWIASRLKKDGFEITPDALILFSECIEGNLLAAFQEIEKLKLVAQGNIIDENIVRESVLDSARYDVFDLADAVLDGNIKTCMRILGVLKGESVEPPVVLWALVREIRLLSHLGHQLSKGLSQDAALSVSAKVVGFSPYLLKRRSRLIHKAIMRHSGKNLRSMLILAGQIDAQIKGLIKGDTWHNLRILSLTLAGEIFLNTRNY
ncbi:MAG: DNA polymerase III subunit delta [Candidatus Endonucleobacter bathymodioli]|uniref:DNA polymerase III subunit delta n=1 Tax=Candidatus Endonucleibacter bathymodioli TaxID=539814 RepID=A0AA90NKJ7_9GAMM|nr:DNA polymerase III subunit delta [Candidatus Endonucleobacter bathymodioli]